MGLYTREQCEKDIRELEARKAKLARLLVECVNCGEELPSLPGLVTWEHVQGLGKYGAGRMVTAPEVLEAVFKNKTAQICCPSCGAPRQSAITADQFMIVGREIDRSIEACKNRLVMSAITIAEQSKMRKMRIFGWVIGATKLHEAWCKKNQVPHEERIGQYCSCDGMWRQTRNKGVLLRHMSNNYRESTVLELMRLQASGVTLMEVVPRRTDKEQPIHEDEPENVPSEWIKVDIEHLHEYQAAGHWEFRAHKKLPNVIMAVWNPRWMTRMPMLVVDANGCIPGATYFEAMEIGYDRAGDGAKGDQRGLHVVQPVVRERKPQDAERGTGDAQIPEG